MIMIQHFLNKLWHVNMIQQSEQDVVSDSLILTSSKPGVPKEHYNNFCLGLPDWCPCCTGDEWRMAEVPLEQKKVKNYNDRFSFDDVII